MPVGRIVRAIGGFYSVASLSGAAEIVQCSVRGKLKLSAEGILVGDHVDYVLENEQGVIQTVLPRNTELKRPYIANVDLILLVFAHKDPDPNPYLLAKFLVLAETSGIPYTLVFNKTDLVGKGKADNLANLYRNYGYKVICSSSVTHLGKRTLHQAITGKVTVLAGPSGVGKSALLNMIAPGFSLQTGSISNKIGRGKHTTREVQLLKINRQSFAADTPGFTQIDLDFIEPIQLKELFPDFRQYQDSCKFSTCLHCNEPGCSVKDAVVQGKFNAERYQTYLKLLQEVQQNWQNRYR